MNTKLNINKNELLWVTGLDESGNLKYVITSNADRSLYYIYDKDCKKLGKAKSPVGLEEKYMGEQ